MSDYTKEAIEHGIAAVRWAMSALVASLHKDFDPSQDIGVGMLSNELRKALVIIDEAWDSFCRLRDNSNECCVSHKENPERQTSDSRLPTCCLCDKPVAVRAFGSDYCTYHAANPDKPPCPVCGKNESVPVMIENKLKPHRKCVSCRHVWNGETYYEVHPPIPGADKPNPLRRPTSEGEAQMRMEREMAETDCRVKLHPRIPADPKMAKQVYKAVTSTIKDKMVDQKIGLLNALKSKDPVNAALDLVTAKARQRKFCGACVHRKCAGTCEVFPMDTIDAHDGQDCAEFEAGDGIDYDWVEEHWDTTRKLMALYESRRTEYVDKRWWRRIRTEPNVTYEPAHILVERDGAPSRLCDEHRQACDLRYFRQLTPKGLKDLPLCSDCNDLLSIPESIAAALKEEPCPDCQKD